MGKEQMIVVAAIIEKDGKYLITQRPENIHLALKWEFPGGRVNFGEDPAIALRREIKEELGADIHVFRDRPFTYSSFVYDDLRHVILLAFSCYLPFEKRIKKIGVKDYKWVTLKEMSNYDFCEADLPIVKTLQKRFLR